MDSKIAMRTSTNEEVILFWAQAAVLKNFRDQSGYVLESLPKIYATVTKDFFCFCHIKVYKKC